MDSTHTPLLPNAKEESAATPEVECEDTPQLLTAAMIAYNAVTDWTIRSGLLWPENATHWSALTPDEKQEIVGCVRFCLANKVGGAQVIHMNWLRGMKKLGWTFAHDENVEQKVSPMVRPWNSLPAFERTRMRLFFQIVTTLA